MPVNALSIFLRLMAKWNSIMPEQIIEQPPAVETQPAEETSPAQELSPTSASQPANIAERAIEVIYAELSSAVAALKFHAESVISAQAIVSDITLWVQVLHDEAKRVETKAQALKDTIEADIKKIGDRLGKVI
jgi:hypothetical protein